MPAQTVDEALAAGRLDPKLPYIKKVGVEALTAIKGEKGDVDAIAQRVRAFYQEQYADLVKNEPARIDAAVAGLQDIYRQNIFPDMNVTWGTHPNNLGHETSPGCFRCHDDVLKDAEGKTIGQDCTICHAVLAWDEQDPEILQKLGLQ